MVISEMHGRTVYIFTINQSYNEHWVRWGKKKRHVKEHNYHDLKCADCGKQATVRVVEETSSTWLWCGECEIG